MKFLGFAFLAAFAVWAVGVVNIDIATKMIPNSRLALGGRLILLALGLLLLNTWLGRTGAVTSYLIWNFYLLWCAHLCWASLAGVILWYSEIWPAGDAKFFILVAAWLPLINPFIKNFPNYLFLSLLVNIFVVAALAAIGSYIGSGFAQASPADFFKELLSDLKSGLRGLAGEKGKNKWLIASYLVNMTFLFLLQQVLNAESRHLLSRFLARPDIIYFFLFFLWDKIGKAFQSKKWLYFTTGCYVLYFFAGYFYFYDRLLALVLGAMLNVLKFSLLLFVGRFMLEILLEKKDTVYLKASELEPGMILLSKTAHTLRRNPAFEGAFDDCFKDGLTVEQVGILREWLGKMPMPDPKIEVVRGKPFALWILAGAVLSLLFDKNVVNLLK